MVATGLSFGNNQPSHPLPVSGVRYADRSDSIMKVKNKRSTNTNTNRPDRVPVTYTLFLSLSNQAKNTAVHTYDHIKEPMHSLLLNRPTRLTM